ncbi:hypothetical protein TNCV_187501 [Trichonephila clavipes]|nr:hypothetical protein TNCV_187501 [Trichonephila clavipes]
MTLLQGTLVFFGLLKRALGKRHPKTLNGLSKAVQEEESKIGTTVRRKSLLSRKLRAKTIIKKHGHQIEATHYQKYGIYR